MSTRYGIKTMRINENNARIGMIVKLTHPLYGYKIGHSNPAVGTEYEVTGIITDFSEIAVCVEWKNGIRNVYDINTLSSIEDLPDGNIRSIWD